MTSSSDDKQAFIHQSLVSSHVFCLLSQLINVNETTGNEGAPTPDVLCRCRCHILNPLSSPLVKQSFPEVCPPFTNLFFSLLPFPSVAVKI